MNCVKCGEQVIITQVRIYQRNCTIAQEQPDVASNSNVSDTNVASDGNNGSIHSLQIPSHVRFDHCSSQVIEIFFVIIDNKSCACTVILKL